MDAENIERTRFYEAGVSVDCSGWDSFAIVESTMRGFKLHYRVLVDENGQGEVECVTQPE